MFYQNLNISEGSRYTIYNISISLNQRKQKCPLTDRFLQHSPQDQHDVQLRDFLFRFFRTAGRFWVWNWLSLETKLSLVLTPGFDASASVLGSGVFLLECLCERTATTGAALTFENTHMERLENGHPLTGAAPTALTVVHGGVEAIVVSRQIEVYTWAMGRKSRVIE